MFSGSFSSVLTLPIDMLSTENLISDGFYGCCVVTCTLCAFISLVWLREQIIRGGGPDWLDHHNNAQAQNVQAQEPPQEPVGQNEDDNNNNNDEGIGIDDNEIEEIDNNNEEPAVAVVNNNNAIANVEANAGPNLEQIDWNPAAEWDRAAEELTWERVCNFKFELLFEILFRFRY